MDDLLLAIDKNGRIVAGWLCAKPRADIFASRLAYNHVLFWFNFCSLAILSFGFCLVHVKGLSY